MGQAVLIAEWCLSSNLAARQFRLFRVLSGREAWLLAASELYRRILGIEGPWKIERGELRRADGEVHVFLEHD